MNRTVPSSCLAAALASCAVAAAPAEAGEGLVSVAVCLRGGPSEPLGPWLDDLAAVVEAKLSEEEGVELVERSRLDSVLKELGLAAAQDVPAADALSLGRLVRADVLLQGTLVRDERGAALRWRVVDVASGAVLHSPSVRAETPLLAEVAAEMAREVVRACRREPPPFASVAVGVFENRGNSPRLDFLEFGLRRLVVEGLLRIPGLRVLERENVRELAREAELGARGPVERPLEKKERRASFFVSGEVTETAIDGERGVRARVVVWRPGRRTALASMDREARLSHLGALADRIAEAVAGVAGGRPAEAPPSAVETRTFRETAFLCMNMLGMPSWRVPLVRRPVKTHYRVESERRTLVLRKATNALECAQYLDPDDLRAPVQLARCLMLRDAWDYERAGRLLANVYGRDPEGLFGACALELLAELERKARVRARAPEKDEERLLRREMARLEDLVELTPEHLRKDTHADWLLRMAGLQLELGRNSAAVDTYLRYVDAACSSAERAGSGTSGLEKVIGRLFGLAEELGRLDEAVERVREHRDNRDPWARYRVLMSLAELASEKGRWKEAALCYDEARENPHPELVIAAWQRLADAHVRSGDAAKAAEYLEALVAFQERHGMRVKSGTVEALGDLYERTGRSEKAVELYRKARSYPWYEEKERLLERLARLGAGKPSPSPAKARFHLSFRVYTPPASPVVYDMAFDPPFVWCVCYEGRRQSPRHKGVLQRLDLRTGRWTRYGWPEGAAPGSEAVGPPNATSVESSPQRVWVGTCEQGLWHLDKESGTWKAVRSGDGLPSNFVTALALDGNDLYVSLAHCEWGALARYDIERGEFRLFRAPEAPRHELADLAVGPHHVWTVTYTDGALSQCDKRSASWHRPLGRSFRRVAASGGPAFFFPSGSWSVHRKDPDSRLPCPIRFLHRGHPLRKRFRGLVFCDAVEKWSYLWLAGFDPDRPAGSGVFRYSPVDREFTAFGPDEGLNSSSAWAARAWKDAVWFGTDAGLVKVERRAASEVPGEERRARAGETVATDADRPSVTRTDSAAIPALVEAMRGGDRYARERALEALSRIGGGEKALVSLLRDPDPRVRGAAARGLRHGKSPSALEALIRAVRDADADVRSQAAYALRALKDERAVEPLAALVGDADGGAANAAAEALAAIGGKAVDVLLEEMHHPLAERRARAAYYLALADGAPVERVAGALSDPSPKVRESAIAGLGRARDPRAVPFLLGAVRDPDEKVGRRAARALGEGFPEEVDALDEVFSHGREAIRREAAKYLFGSRHKAVPLDLLEIGLADESAQVRRLAAGALLKAREHEALELVLKALADPDQLVRSCASRSRLLSERELRDALVRALGEDSGAIRAWASGSLSRSPHASTLEAFLKLLESDPVARVRANAAEALGRLGGPKAVEALVRALGDEDKDVRWKAVTALRRLGDRAALTSLREALRREKDGRTRRLIEETIKALEDGAKRR